MKRDLKQVCDTISQIKDSGQFKKYINSITFPFFRNLSEKTQIEFKFPLSVFVGHNGAGKSSTLHALYGSPEGTTPSDFWFETKVDPIIEDRHRFYYEYVDDNGDAKEVIKTRIKKSNNPDYWETSRPLIRDGMKKVDGGKRNTPVKKKVVYLDFRSELSAFDKYFYFGNVNGLKSSRKQDYIRAKSAQLKKVLDGIREYKNHDKSKSPLHDDVRKITDKELMSISYILGKEYSEGKIVRHSFYKETGFSILFTTKHAMYSEAFAGSGETAVTRLVLDVLDAPNYSLILLDEPEVSLHPGAQKRLKFFLLEQVKKKKCQIIVSTHSPHLVEGLPPNAIKVFTQQGMDGKFQVSNENIPEVAFHYIEHNIDKKRVIVEDILAKMIIDSVIRKFFDKAAPSLLEIEFFPGGCDNLKKDFIKVFSQENSTDFIFFDGDQRYKGEIDYRSLKTGDLTLTHLKKLVERATSIGFDKIGFHPDGGIDGANEEQLMELIKKYLDFYINQIRFLPQMIPEDIIWCDNFASSLLALQGEGDKFDNLQDIDNSKDKFYTLSQILGIDISACYQQAINYWISNDDNQDLKTIRLLIKEVLEYGN